MHTNFFDAISTICDKHGFRLTATLTPHLRPIVVADLRSFE